LTFADEDVQVVAVGDGKKAIASIQSDRPDIVLADVGMPERGGYEVAAVIKGNPQFASIPVLLLTGAFEPIDETRARAVGCDGVLVKPFEPQMVINRVKDLLAGRRPSSLWSANPPAQAPTRQPEAAARAKEVDVQAPVPREAQVATGGSLEDYFDRLDAAFATVEGASEAQAAPLSATSPPRPAAAAPAAHPITSTAFSPVDLGDWDPDLAGDPEKPAAVQPPPTPVAAAPSPPVPVPVAAVPPPPASVPVAPPPSVPVAATPPPAAPAPQPPPVATSRASQAPPVPAAPAPAAPHSPPSPAPVHARPEAPVTPVVPGAAVAPAPAMPSLAEAFAALLSAEQSRSISASTIGASAVSDDTVDDIVRRVIARMGDQAVRDTVVDVAERLVREEIERIKGS
jgi:CheY-like chemotaxis protein